MGNQEIETRVREILGHYRINQKFQRGVGGRNYAYAVFAGPNLGRSVHHPNVKQISEDLTSAEAKKLQTDLIVADLVGLIESLKESNHEHQK